MLGACFSFLWLSLWLSPDKVRIIGLSFRYNEAMIPESEEKGHGEDKEDATGHIYKTIFNGASVSGVPGVPALERRFRLSPLQVSPWIPAVQRTISMRQVPTSNLCNGRNCAPWEPYAADKVVSGVLSGVHGQAQHLRHTVVLPTRSHLQDRLVYAEKDPHCHGAAGQQI